MVQKRVTAAYQRQLARAGKQNSLLDNQALTRCAQLQTRQLELLYKAVSRLNLSTRAMYRTLRVARTVADLEGADAVREQHLSEAIAYRVAPLPALCH